MSTRVNEAVAQEQEEDFFLGEAEGDLVVMDSIDVQDPEPLLQLVRMVNQLVAEKEPSKQVAVSVLGNEQWQRVLQKIVPKKLLARGLGKHFNILISPKDRRHVLVGPGAVGNVAEENRTGYSEVVYTLINATGESSNEVLERGCADIIAQEISKKTGVSFYANNYPEEAEFVLDLVKSFKPKGEKTLPWVLLLKNNPDKFFEELQKSEFYRWWERFARKKDALSQFVRLFESLSSPNGQLKGSFLQWAQVCTKRFVQFREYREQQEAKKNG